VSKQATRALTRMPLPPAGAVGTFCWSRSGPLAHALSTVAVATDPSCSARNRVRTPPPPPDVLVVALPLPLPLLVPDEEVPGRTVGRTDGVAEGRVPSTLPPLVCELAAEEVVKRVTSPVTSFTTAMRYTRSTGWRVSSEKAAAGTGGEGGGGEERGVYACMRAPLPSPHSPCRRASVASDALTSFSTMARDAFTALALLAAVMDTRNGICTTACGGRGLVEGVEEGVGRRVGSELRAADGVGAAVRVDSSDGRSALGVGRVVEGPVPARDGSAVRVAVVVGTADCSVSGRRDGATVGAADCAVSLLGRVVGAADCAVSLLGRVVGAADCAVSLLGRVVGAADCAVSLLGRVVGAADCAVPLVPMPGPGEGSMD
jgi:hypothetical protein